MTTVSASELARRHEDAARLEERISNLLRLGVAASLAPSRAPPAPTESKGSACSTDTSICAQCGRIEANEAGVTANAFRPAARLMSMPWRIIVGTSRKPGPTPMWPVSTEIGTAYASRGENRSCQGQQRHGGKGDADAEHAGYR